MDKTRYKITCGSCKADRIIDIQKTPAGDFVDWLEDRAVNTKIISARPRLDGQWGFQCFCGNNDLMTEQEKNSIENHSAPKPQEIDEIVAKLKIQKPKFSMVRA